MTKRKRETDTDKQMISCNGENGEKKEEEGMPSDQERRGKYHGSAAV